MTYENKDILLRELKVSDADEMYKHVKDIEISKWTANIPFPYPEGESKKFILKTQRMRRSKKLYSFGIVLKVTGNVIGVVSLMKVNEKNKNSEIGYWIAKRYWNKGYMTGAVRLMTEFGFRELRLHRIYAKPFKENIASRKVLEKSGFALEGEIRENIMKYNKWHNTLLYGILNKK